MKKKRLILDGNKINSLDDFFIVAYSILTKDFIFQRGSLDGFNDILSGGFGVFENEPIILIWKNSIKSKEILGYSETVKYYEDILKTCHSTNINYINAILENCKQKNGQTLFDIIIEIINEHNDIELILE